MQFLCQMLFVCLFSTYAGRYFRMFFTNMEHGFRICDILYHRHLNRSSHIIIWLYIYISRVKRSFLSRCGSVFCGINCDSSFAISLFSFSFWKFLRTLVSPSLKFQQEMAGCVTLRALVFSVNTNLFLLLYFNYYYS